MIEDEVRIDTWIIQYISPAGNKYSGKLTITNKRLLYKPFTNFSAMDRARNFISAINKNESEIQIEKTVIAEVLVEKTASSKNAILVLSDGSRHTFNYGALNIDKVVEAIRST